MSSLFLFTDVDECSTPANRCRYACKNTIGSFMCVCPEGFNQVGKDDCRGKTITSTSTSPLIFYNLKLPRLQHDYIEDQVGTHNKNMYFKAAWIFRRSNIAVDVLAVTLLFASRALLCTPQEINKD